MSKINILGVISNYLHTCDLSHEHMIEHMIGE